MRVAAIDVGTNTTRLLVAERSSPAVYRDLTRRLEFTRLGEGVEHSGRLRDEAVERTLTVVGEFCAECGEMGVGRIRVVGTSALRDALNPDAFAEGVLKLAGTNLEILTGEDEGRLSFLGAIQDLGHGSYLVCDIGGGSTEFVLGEREMVAGRTSLDLGSVRLTERHLVSDPPATEEMLLLEGEVDRALESVKQVLSGAEHAKLVGVAGTVTTLAAMHLALSTYDPAKTHLLRMEATDVSRQYRRIAGMTIGDRKKITGMPEGRADVIVAGAAILSRVMRYWSFGSVTVSEKDILDGLVLDMLQD